MSPSRLALPLTLLAVLVVFLPGLRAGFVYDDQTLVLLNDLTGSLANAPEMFRVDLWASVPSHGEEMGGYYRPLMLVSLALDRALAGFDPVVAHLHNLLWHLGAVLLLHALLRRVVRDPLAAAAGAALFAVHPAVVEAVQWIAGRNDPMAAVFLFAGLLLLSAPERGRGATAAGGLAVFAALLCKESVALAPVLLAGVSWARNRSFGDRAAHGAVLVALAAYLALRALAGVGLPPGAGLARTVEVLPVSLAFYAEKLVWPVDLVPALHLGWPPPTPWLALAGALLVAALLVVAGGRRALAGLLFAALTWAPALAALAALGLLADRYLYLPLAGLGLALAAALEGRRAAGPVFALVLVAGAALSSRQLPAWKDDETLWLSTLRRHPHSGYAAGAYAKLLEDEGRLDEAVAWYRAATQPPRPFAHSCYNVVSLQLKRGDLGAAVHDGRRALENGCARSPELLAPLALALALTGQWEEAEARAAEVGVDPTGKAVLVRIAAAARRGDFAPFEAAAAGQPEARAALAAQVARVLEQGGEPDLAAAVRARG